MRNVFVLAQEISSNNVSYWFNQGFAVMVVIALGWAVYTWMRWAGGNILVPLKDAGIEHLRETTACMKSVQTTLAEQHTVVREIHSTVGNLKTTVEEISSDVDILKKRNA